MPQVRRKAVPRAVLDHLLERINDRSVSSDQLTALAAWLDQTPEVPVGRWFKRFAGVTVCGRDELILTFLLPDCLSFVVMERHDIREALTLDEHFAHRFIVRPGAT